MSNRKLLLVAGAAVGCLILLLCAGVAILAGYSYYTASVGVRTIDRIAYMDNDLNIQVVDGQGSNHVSVTSDGDNIRKAYLYPTWAPDSQSLALLSLTQSQGSRQASLDVVAPSGGITRTVFKSNTDFPFYLYWSPDSQRIAFLTQAQTGMKLMVGRADGKEDALQLQTGASTSLYWAWSPDSRDLLLHSGGSSRDSDNAAVSLFASQNVTGSQKVADKPGAFLAPQFSPDGSALLYAANASDHDTLFRADSRGVNPQPILDYTGTVAFAWSPDGKKIATLVTPDDASLPVESPIFLSDADGKNRKQVTTEKVMMFYWSPDSQRIAFLTLVTPAQSSTGPARPAAQTPIKLRWQVLTIADGNSRTVATFAPTENFVSLIPFFDQYAHSITFWSPDSKRLVYSQDENGTDGSIWVVNVDGDPQPHRVGDGTLAVWSWK